MADSKSSFFAQNSTVYTDTNPSGPADTPVSSTNTEAPSSFYKGTGTQNEPLSYLAGIPALEPIAHNFLTGISATGVWDYAQPSFSDISGMIDPLQIPPAALLSLGGVDATTPVASKWVQYINTSGQQILSQPAFSDISGVISATQIPDPALTTLGGVLAINAAAHEWVSYIDTSGQPHLAQPAFSDISGTVASTQLPEATTSALGAIKAIAAVSHQWVEYIDNTGVPHLTQPAASDISGLATSATTDTTNAANITSGTLPAARLPVPTVSALGGVESATAPTNEWMTGINTSGVPQFAQPAFSNLSGVASNAQIPAPTTSALGGLKALSAATAHEWVTYIGTTGVQTLAQPAFTDISGTLAASQLPAPTLSALGGVEAISAVSHQWINSINTSGVPQLSQPAASDISGLAASATTDTTNAANISSGTLPAARLPAPSATTLGGVESAAAVTHQWINSISTGGVPALSQPAASDISGLATSATTDTTNASNIGSGTLATGRLSTSMQTASVQFVIDGGGVALTTGVKGYLEVPFACTINQVTLLADQTGSVEVDIWKCTYANFDAGSTHPVVGDTITASDKPTISSAVKAQDATLTGWTTAISAGDILAYDVVSATTVTRVTIDLKVTKS